MAGYCRNCGNPLEDGDIFCSACGQRRGTVTPEPVAARVGQASGATPTEQEDGSLSGSFDALGAKDGGRPQSQWRKYGVGIALSAIGCVVVLLVALGTFSDSRDTPTRSAPQRQVVVTLDDQTYYDQTLRYSDAVVSLLTRISTKVHYLSLVPGDFDREALSFPETNAMADELMVLANGAMALQPPRRFAKVHNGSWTQGWTHLRNSALLLKSGLNNLNVDDIYKSAAEMRGGADEIGQANITIRSLVR